MPINDTKTILWDRPKMKRFRKAYQKAKEAQDREQKDTFIFEGNEFVVGYAKYLLDYLEEELRLT